MTYSDYDEDVGYLFKLLGWKNLAHQHGIEKATMVYKYLHGLAPEYLSGKFNLFFNYITLETLRINLASLYHGQIITKITSAIVVPSYGTNSRVM